uniref:SAP domain-containing ribonucleoprotein n=1 Tax=Equus asinus TaxID=9793 RepID=A0A9L0K4D2_EQUAS
GEASEDRPPRGSLGFGAFRVRRGTHPADGRVFLSRGSPSAGLPRRAPCQTDNSPRAGIVWKNIAKLAELKQECLARGLETKGIKQDLINRLQAYLEEHAEEEANEEDVLGDETEEEEPKPIELPVKEEEPPEKTVDVAAEKKVVKITSEIPQTERMQKRAERFNVPVSLESKKAARAARFGISSVPSKGLSSDTKPMVNLDKLKERAQRFGLNVSSISRKSEDDEKLKKRKERFGIVTSSAGTGTTEDTEAKKRKRAERFGIA